jgi:hypothetical protein
MKQTKALDGPLTLNAKT